MVSDSELVDRLREFLSTSDLTTTTTTSVRRKLEEDFGIDLSDKKVFIREQVDLYLESQFQLEQQKNEGEMHDEVDDGPPAEVSDEEEDAAEEEEEEEQEESEAVTKVKRRSSKKKYVKF